jgi:hypothetical protein
LLTGGDAGRPGRERLDECTHKKHQNIKLGTVNRQYNETDLFLCEDVSFMSLPVWFLVDEVKAASV